MGFKITEEQKQYVRWVKEHHTVKGKIARKKHTSQVMKKLWARKKLYQQLMDESK